MAQHARASPQSLQSAYDHLLAFPSAGKLRDAALTSRLHIGAAASGAAVPGRSIAWKLFLLQPSAPLLPTSELNIQLYLDSIRKARYEYRDLLMEKMRAPDGSYEESLVIPGLNTSPPRRTATASDLSTNNPLSLHVENPWKEWFSAIELRKEITQDVERTFPDIAYFRDSVVQAQLANVLYLWASTNPDIGYRQGMHELLAMLYFAVDFDAINDAGNVKSLLAELCAQTWVAADAWALFVQVMNGVKQWYEWREPSAPTVGTSPLPHHVNLPLENGQLKSTPYVSPIVQACNELQNVNLKNVDPQLWRSMQAAGIEPQIFGIRWLRLLFTREFGMTDTMVLWDGIFACDPSLSIAKWICVAMLIRIRNQLIPADYSEQLTFLLRYPPIVDPDTAALAEIHHTSLLLRQAIALQLSPNPMAGTAVIAENRMLLNIPLEVPEPPPPRSRPGRSRGGTSQPGTPGGRMGHMKQASSQMNLPDIARGILDRGESLGINKTSFLSAVSEIRRNLPDIAATAASYVRSPTTPGYAAFPLADERTPEERPPWEARSRNEFESEIARLKAVQRQLGQSLGWIVDTLLQSSNDDMDEAALQALSQRKSEALESLAYVRDVLQRGSNTVEEDRLFSEEELKKRKERDVRSQNDERPIAALLPAPTRAAVPSPSLDAMGRSSPSTLPRSFSRFQTPPTATMSYPDSPSPPTAGQPTSGILSPAGENVPVALAPWKSTKSNFSAASPAVTLPQRTSTVAASLTRNRSPVPPPATSLPRTPVTSAARSPAMSAASPARSDGSFPSSSPTAFTLTLPPSRGEKVQRQEVKDDPLGALH